MEYIDRKKQIGKQLNKLRRADLFKIAHARAFGRKSYYYPGGRLITAQLSGDMACRKSAEYRLIRHPLAPEQ
jgi:hypothetical protein